ncbi:solute carrier family 35 member F6-like [Oppia nitens]|uniref:solute carrier family 35 member F6-like n=1 Tax=Oppia nitens TaxID=1686743 RepID=UPI0023DCCABA|nr:solute carrier family 35 member F6-like [Oppia nitens]
MAWSKYQIFLALLMVITGSINTLATKWADITNSVGKDGKSRPFNHPFLQAVSMFLGELSCLLAYKLLYLYYKQKDYTDEQLPPSISGSRSFNPLIFLPPALCDMTATSLMYIGLNLTYASSFQMLRGSLIIFTGLLSVAFLNRNLKHYQWIGIFFVMTGLAIVGVSDMVFGSHNDAKGSNGVITGDLLIIMAQIITATQMVVEEKFVSGSNVSPLQAVGWEGLYGVCILSTLLIPMYYIPTGNLIFKNPDGQMEDAIDGFVQIFNSWQVTLGLLGTIISISFFNFAGISVTKQMSATTRTVLDSVRTFVIWIFSLSIGWEKLSNRTFIQVTGFSILLIGMFLYNNVLIRPFLISRGLLRNNSSEAIAILQDTDDTENAIRPTMHNPSLQRNETEIYS